VNPVPLLKLVHANISTKNLLINLSNVAGSKDMLVLLFRGMFDKPRFHKIEYNLEKYWLG